MQFSAIPGLTKEKKLLIQAVQQNHLAHALLFNGPEGSGNLALTLALATYLNCENPGEEDACGTCPACQKNMRGVHPDVNFVFPVSSIPGISGKDVISQNFLKPWRNFIQEQPFGNASDWAQQFGAENKQLNISKEESRQIVQALSLKAFEGKHKIMLIWLPEYLHPAAANGILKILEEPPENTHFLLVSNDADKLLTTILSRTQQFQVPAFTDEEVKQYLMEKVGVPEEQASQSARLAEGNMREALILGQSIENDQHPFFADWLRSCFTRDFSDLVDRAEKFQTMSKMAQFNFMQYALNMLREVLLQSAAADQLVRVSGQEEKFVANFSKVMTEAKLERLMTLLNEGAYHLERNVTPRMIFLDISLQIAHFLRN